MSSLNDPLSSIFPVTANVNHKGHLTIGTCDCVDLIEEFGSPLYVFDETTIRSQCREFRTEFTNLYPKTLVAYASKAFLNRYIAIIIKSEKLGLDTVSGGEISVAKSVNFPASLMYFHGNNKSEQELNFALDNKISRVVVDNLYELELLNKIAAIKKIKQDILLRLSPGIDAHTHKFTTTGILDSKFGFAIATGQAETAIVRALSLPNINLIGLHCHLGSPIFETSPYEMAIDLLIQFAQTMSEKYNLRLQEFSPGGGFAVKYVRDTDLKPIKTYAKAIVETLKNSLDKTELAEPKLIIEPGRSIIARSGVALYKVGGIKEIPSIRTYISVDGGMGDNIRPVLYDSKYEAILANKATDTPTTKVTIAGRYCESGDILSRDVLLPPVTSGDIIAMPAAGAYAIPMSSNYNMVPKPAIIVINNGKAKIIRKRETYRDLMKLDVI
jgi:diaminopimelate decarboxylase